MAGQRELSFDDDKSVNYVVQVIVLMNAGDYTEARNIITKIPDKMQRKGVYRTVAHKTGIHL